MLWLDLVGVLLYQEVSQIFLEQWDVVPRLFAFGICFLWGDGGGSVRAVLGSACGAFHGLCASLCAQFSCDRCVPP